MASVIGGFGVVFLAFFLQFTASAGVATIAY